MSKNLKQVGGKFDSLKSKAKEIVSKVKGLVRRSHEANEEMSAMSEAPKRPRLTLVRGAG